MVTEQADVNRPAAKWSFGRSCSLLVGKIGDDPPWSEMPSSTDGNGTTPQYPSASVGRLRPLSYAGGLGTVTATYAANGNLKLINEGAWNAIKNATVNAGMTTGVDVRNFVDVEISLLGDDFGQVEGNAERVVKLESDRARNRATS